MWLLGSKQASMCSDPAVRSRCNWGVFLCVCVSAIKWQAATGALQAENVPIMCSKLNQHFYDTPDIKTYVPPSNMLNKGTLFFFTHGSVPV